MVFAAGVWRECLRVYKRWRKLCERADTLEVSIPSEEYDIQMT